MKKTALITGISGQDGAYLAQFLLKKIIKLLALIEDQQDRWIGGTKDLALKIR